MYEERTHTEKDKKKKKKEHSVRSPGAIPEQLDQCWCNPYRHDKGYLSCARPWPGSTSYASDAQPSYTRCEMRA